MDNAMTIFPVLETAPKKGFDSTKRAESIPAAQSLARAVARKGQRPVIVHYPEFLGGDEFWLVGCAL